MDEHQHITYVVPVVLHHTFCRTCGHWGSCTHEEFLKVCNNEMEDQPCKNCENRDLYYHKEGYKRL